jgi:predicted dehydrogenase
MTGGAPLRLGIVGTGAIALRGLLPHLTQDDVQDRVQVAAVCDPVPGRAEAVAERFGVPQSFMDIETLLAQGDVDAVSIASPIGLHQAQARLALEAGAHVHVNKTLSTTVAEADDLIALASEHGLGLVASPGEALRPQLHRIRELISGGAIGRLAFAVCGCAFGAYHESDEPERLAAPGDTPIDPAWYFRKPGGGPMYDMTVYALHQLTAVLGPARRVTALSGQVVPVREFLGRAIEVEADDNTILLLDFGDGAFAVAYGAASAGTIIDDFAAGSYYGTTGAIVGLELNGEPFEFAGRELTTHAPAWDWDAQMHVLPHVVGPHREIPESHVFEDVMQLVGLVREGTPTAANPEHARHVIDIIESGYLAAESGQTQTLRTSFDPV